MSVWQRVLDTLSHRNPLAALGAADRDPRDSVTFTIAVIALAAKLSKADGQVTRDEVSAFRQVFLIEPDQEASVAKAFNLFRQDVVGFESYARQIARLFENDNAVLKDLMDGLFFISMADGIYHPNEHEYLRTVSEIFGISEACFRQLTARFVPGAWDPYTVIGVPYDASRQQIRRKYREEVKQAHPDRLIARGMPKEMIELGTRRIADLNRAWEELKEQATV